MTTNVATEVTPAMRVTRNVKHLLVMFDMTDKELAAALGWSSSKASRILSGKTGWDINDLPAVAKVFGLDYTALFATPTELLSQTSGSTPITDW